MMFRILLFLLSFNVMAQVLRVNSDQVFNGARVRTNFVKNPSCNSNARNITATGLTVSATTAGNLTERSACAINPSAIGQHAVFEVFDFEGYAKNKTCSVDFYYEGSAALLYEDYEFFVEINGVAVSAFVPSQALASGETAHSGYITHPCGDLTNMPKLKILSKRALAPDIRVAKVSHGIDEGPFLETSSPMAYTPTFTGFGTPTNVNFISWREGSFLMVKGFFTAGTPTATEARITLGHEGVNGNVTTSSNISAVAPEQCGDGRVSQTLSATDFAGRPVLCEPSKDYMTFTAEYSTFGTGLAKANGNGLLVAGATYSFMAKVQIEGWGGTNVWKVGFPGQDWTAFTPTSTIITSNVTHSGFYQCDAGNLKVQTASAFSGTNTQGNFVMSLPSGFTMDTAKLASTSNAYPLFGSVATIRDSGGPDYYGAVYHNDSTSIRVRYTNDATGSSVNPVSINTMSTSSGSPMTIANGDAVWMSYEVPVTADSPCPRSSTGLFKNAVTTSEVTTQNIVNVRFGGGSYTNCTSSPCTIEIGGAGITDVTRSGTGSYSVNFETGTFSETPVCTCIQKVVGVNDGHCQPTDTEPSSSSFTVQTRVSATSTLIDANVNMICIGDK